MDQKELDDAYDQSVYAPNQQLLAKRRRIASEAALKRLGQPERVAYGPTEIEKLDIYRTRRSNGRLIFSFTAALGETARQRTPPF